MTDIGPFQSVVAIRFPSGISGQYIFDAIQDMTLLFKNFTGTVNGDPVTIDNTNVVEYGEIELAEGRNIIKGRQLIESEPMEIATNYDFQYTSAVENWTLFKFFESPTVSIDRTALRNYVLDELEKPRLPYPATAFQSGINWFELPAQPSDLVGERLNLMFCGSFGCGDLVNLSMPNATQAIGMFCRSEGINWNLLKAPMLEDAAYMFAHCNSLWSTNKEPPAFLSKLKRSEYMFYGSEIDEVNWWTATKLERAENMFANSDVEIIENSVFTISGRAWYFLEGCGKLEIVRNSNFESEEFREFNSGSDIITWHNNSMSSEESPTFPDEVFLSGANITDSEFSTGISVFAYGSYFGNSECFALRGDQNTTIIGSTIQRYFGGGLVQDSKIESFNNTETIVGEFFGNEIGGYTFFNRNTAITQFYGNKYICRNTILRSHNNGVIVEYMDVSGIEFDDVGTGPGMVVGYLCKYLTGVNSSTVGNPSGISGNTFNSFDDEPEPGTGVEVAESLEFSTPTSGYVINQKIDIELRSCFIDLTEQIDQFYDRFNNQVSVELFGARLTLIDSDINFAKHGVKAGEYVFVNSVLTEPNLYQVSPEILGDVIQSVVRGCLTYPKSETKPFFCDFDFSDLETLFFFRNSGVIGVINFFPVSMTDDFYGCKNLERLVNSNFYLGYDEQLEYDNPFNDERRSRIGQPEITGDRLVQVAGCTFYKRLYIVNESSDPEQVVSITNNQIEGDFYYNASGQQPVEIDFFNNRVLGSIDCIGAKCSQATGVMISKSYNDHLRFEAKSSSGVNLSGLSVAFDHSDGRVVDLITNVIEVARIGTAPKIIAAPQIDWSGAGDCGLAIPESILNRSEFEFLPRYLVAGAIAESVRSGAYDGNTHFQIPAPYYSGRFAYGAVMNYRFDHFFETEPLVYDVDFQGEVTRNVDENRQFISLKPGNLAICQQAMFTESDYNYLVSQLENAGFTDINFCHYFRVRNSEIFKSGSRVYYLPNRIEILRG